MLPHNSKNAVKLPYENIGQVDLISGNTVLAGMSYDGNVRIYLLIYLFFFPLKTLTWLPCFWHLFSKHCFTFQT